MAEFRKIELSHVKPQEPKVASREKVSEPAPPMRNRRFIKMPKSLGILAGVISLFVVGAFFAIVLPMQQTISSAKVTQAQAKKVYEALKKQNIELASKELVVTKKDLLDTQEKLHRMAFLKYIPVASWYYNDADHLVNAGTEGLKSATILVDSLKPYADVLGLKGQGSFVMGSAEQRIQTAILTMGKITPRIDDIADSLIKAQKEIDAVDAKHYPPFFGGEKVRSQISTAQTYVDQGVVFVTQARPLIKVLPSLLGESKEKKYLVLFQNDKELRPTGGFITAYAVFKIDKGIIKVEKSEDIYKLDDSVRGKEKAPPPIAKYLPKVSVFNLRDSNLSPDFIDSMKTFRGMYDRASEKIPVDGIIAIDTHVLVATIKILDDEVKAGGLTFTTKEDPNCNCPQAIYALEDNISRPVNYIKADRKGLLGDLLFAIMEKALKSSPKIYWGPLFQAMIEQTNQKHVLFYLYNSDAQSGVEALNAAGRIKPFEGDYLHVNEANFAGGKANLYVSETVAQDYVVGDDRSVEKTLTINYKNPYPPSDCNLERGGLCLNAPLRNWIRIYVPKGSQLVKSQGSEVKMSSYEEFGKTVFEGFLIVRPQKTAKFTITYKLPFKVVKGSPLPLLMQKQPGKNDFDHTISVNGKQVKAFPLKTDLEVRLAL